MANWFTQLFRKAPEVPDKRVAWDQVAVLIKAAGHDPEQVLAAAKIAAETKAAAATSLKADAASLLKFADEAYMQAVATAERARSVSAQDAGTMLRDAEYERHASKEISGVLSLI